MELSPRRSGPFGRGSVALRWVLAAAVALCSASAPSGIDKESLITRMEMRSIETWHYAPPPFNVDFSREVFTLYLKRLDAQKRFLLQANVDSLAHWRDSLSEQLTNGSDDFCEIANAVLNRRVAAVRALTHDIFKVGFRLAADDSMLAEPEKSPYCKTPEELRQRWARLLKYQILMRIEDQREEKATKDSAAGKKRSAAGQPMPDSAQIDSAVAYVQRNLDRTFTRMIHEEKLDRVAVYLDAVANTLDPHTEYFKPEAREEFDLTMSGKLEGIGAVLREDDGYIKVVSIVPGSAAWRQKELKAEDKILKVAQGNQEPVDLVNASVEEAVKLIRGEKGTEVRLTVEDPNGHVKVIPIIRDVVVVEETYAKSAVIHPRNSKRKFGYISLPSFYRDFSNPDGRSSAEDVKKEVARLKARGVAGIILDLRNNGGGALEDAVRMAGLFLPGGPVVQVRDRRGSGSVLEDTDPSVEYAGPLILLVNTFSASASEILAAAMQDYGRAVIVGSDTTFGKGTVQTLIDLDNFATPAEADLKPLGTVKLTVQKFYRITGGSTQFRGVVPDILIPDAYTDLDVGEKSLEHAMPWDTIRALNYHRWADLPLRQLEARSRARIAASDYFKHVDEFLQHQKAFRNDKYIPLGMDKFIAERDRNRKESDDLEALTRQVTDFSVDPLPSRDVAYAEDSTTREKTKVWKEQLDSDFYLRESLEIMNDLIALEHKR